MKNQLVFLTTLLVATTNSIQSMESPKKLLRRSSDKQKLHTSNFNFSKKRPKSVEYSSNHKKNIPLLSCIEEEDPRITDMTNQNMLTTCFYNLAKEDINNVYGNKETALIYAARTNNFELMQHLLRYDNILVNEKNDYGTTAFLYVAQNKNKQAIELFLKNPETDVSVKNNKDENAFQLLKSNNPQTEELYSIILARLWVETIIDKRIVQESQIKNQAELYESICQLIKELRKIEKKEQKKYPAATSDPLFPDYANENFIKDLVFFRLKKKMEDSFSKEYSTSEI